MLDVTERLLRRGDAISDLNVNDNRATKEADDRGIPESNCSVADRPPATGRADARHANDQPVVDGMERLGNRTDWTTADENRYAELQGQLAEICARYRPDASIVVLPPSRGGAVSES
jgi:hypothetical protein